VDVENLERHSQSELCSDVTSVTSYFVLTIIVSKLKLITYIWVWWLRLLAWLNKQPLFWHRQEVRS